MAAAYVFAEPALDVLELVGEVTIVYQALLRDTNLIVMGTHGRSGVAHLLLGNVAERVVRTAPCPVLTVHDTARVDHALFSWDPERAAADAPAHAFAHIRYSDT